MNTLIKQKRILNLILILIIIATLRPQNVLITSAATNTMVFGYSPMIEDSGNIYYVQDVIGDKYSYNLYRLEVATGNKTKLLSTKNDIVSMMLHNDALYYTSYDGEKDIYQTYSVSIDAKDKKTICNGRFISLDDSSIYYIDSKDEKNKLYKRNYNSEKDTLIFTGNQTFSFVKNLDNTLYFTQFDEASSKLISYTLLAKKTKLSVLTTDKITSDGSDRTYTMISDLVKINGAIYYQYGTYQGSGNYWYGTLKKLDPNTKTKSVIVEQLYEAQIYHNDSSIFYNGTDSDEKHYQYNTKTGKTSTYIYKTTGSESFNILGDKTYCAKADGKELITVSRVTSGTNKDDLKSFCKISYKQNKKYDYSASVKKYGDYFLIPVTCMDYNDNSYGWRGRCVSITWYVVSSGGKILAQFQ